MVKRETKQQNRIWLDFILDEVQPSLPAKMKAIGIWESQSAPVDHNEKSNKMPFGVSG
jgi:hypothetical protein